LAEIKRVNNENIEKNSFNIVRIWIANMHVYYKEKTLHLMLKIKIL